MDGVLIDTEKWLNIYWQQAAKEAGFHFTREHGLAIRSLATKYTGPYLQKIFGPEFDYEAIRARRKQLMKEHIEKNPGLSPLKEHQDCRCNSNGSGTYKTVSHTDWYLR